MISGQARAHFDLPANRTERLRLRVRVALPGGRRSRGTVTRQGFAGNGADRRLLRRRSVGSFRTRSLPAPAVGPVVRRLPEPAGAAVASETCMGPPDVDFPASRGPDRTGALVIPPRGGSRLRCSWRSMCSGCTAGAIPRPAAGEAADSKQAGRGCGVVPESFGRRARALMQPARWKRKRGTG
jgi:hypothetical protein